MADIVKTLSKCLCTVWHIPGEKNPKQEVDIIKEWLLKIVLIQT